MSGFLKSVLDILFPPRLVCAACGREAAVGDNGLCGECADGLEAFNAAPILKNTDGYTAALIYNDVSGRMIKGLKYGGKRWLAPVLAGFIELPGEWKIEAVVPVPLYKKRLRERGFNQSELIAASLCERYGLPLDPMLLKRIADTDTQTHRTAAGRRRALKGAFAADEACKGLSVLLVDDVRTTGSTLNECAAALKKAGCAKVYAATVCFAAENN